jgi:hypothetical protein
MTTVQRDSQTDTIQDRLRRGAWVIAVTFIFGFAASFAFFRTNNSTSEYKTTGVVAPPGSVTNPAEAQQYVSDFRAALSSDVVAQRTARATQLSTAQVRARVGSSRQADSAIIKVTYTTDHVDADARKVLGEVVAETSDFLAKDRKEALAAADRDLAAATAAFTKAEAAISEFLANNNGVVPDRAAGAMQDKIVTLTLDEAQATAAGDPNGAAAFAATRILLSAQLGAVREKLTVFAPLRLAEAAAQDQISAAQEARQNALIAASEKGVAVKFAYSKVNQAVSQTTMWVRQSLAIGAAAAVLSAVIIAWFPVRSFARREGRRRARAAGHVS